MFDRDILQLPGARKALALLVVCSSVMAALAAGQALFIAHALTGLWEGARIDSQAVLLAGFAFCLAARRALEFARSAAMGRFAAETAAHLRHDLAGALFDGGPSLVGAKGTGAAVSTLVEGVDKVENYVGLIIPKLAAVATEPIVLLAVLFYADWPSAVAALAVLPFAFFYMMLLGKNARQAAEQRRGSYVVLANHFVDSLRGIETLRAFDQVGSRSDEVFSTSERFREATLSMLRTATLSSLVLDLFATFALAAASILLGFRLLAGQVALVDALAALVLVPEFFAPILKFSRDFHATLDGKNAFSAIRRAIDGAGKAYGDAADVDARVPLWSDRCGLEFDHVSFAYPDSDETSRAALEGACFAARGVEKVGIVGTSGAGKSTLANLLAGFSSPTAGSIVVTDGDERPVASRLTGTSWLYQVCYIPQNPYIFHASVRDNVAFYRPDATDAEVADALERSGLAEFVSTLPDGPDTVVGQGGRAVSGGQAQRMALARAFLDGSSRRVLVFDEPTAHLDVETELALKEPMLELMEGRLVFFATHRLHWMRDMDRILVLEDGRIVEQGPYDLLIEKGGAFERLVRELRGGDGL